MFPYIKPLAAGKNRCAYAERNYKLRISSLCYTPNGHKKKSKRWSD